MDASEGYGAKQNEQMTASQPQFQEESHHGGKKNVVALKGAEINNQGLPE